MADPMGDLWSKTATMFKARVYDYLNRVDIQEEDRKKLEGIPRVIDDFIKVPRNPTTLYTRDNLVQLVECWNVFSSWTYGTRYWNKEFPEWSFMITQFQIFVNEFEKKEMRPEEKEHIDTELNVLKGQIDVILSVANTDRVHTSSTIKGILEEMKGIQEQLKGVQEKMQGMDVKTTTSIDDLGVKITTYQQLIPGDTDGASSKKRHRENDLGMLLERLRLSAGVELRRL
jgi:hypothetical protein